MCKHVCPSGALAGRPALAGSGPPNATSLDTRATEEDHRVFLFGFMRARTYSPHQISEPIYRELLCRDFFVTAKSSEFRMSVVSKGCGRPLSVLTVEPHTGVNGTLEGKEDIADSPGLGVSLHLEAGRFRLVDHRTGIGQFRLIAMSDDRKCDHRGFGAPQPGNVQKTGQPRRRNLSDPISEMLAAWIVVFFVAAIGLLLFYSQSDAARDRLVLSKWHAPPVAGTAEWSDAKCHPAVQSCLILPAEDDSTDAVRALVER